MNTIGRIVYNILPYYLVRKLVLKYTGDAVILKSHHSVNELSGRVHEIDLGEFIFISDKAEFQKKKIALEKALKKTQEKMEELERGGL